jgi:hypothetical protein
MAQTNSGTASVPQVLAGDVVKNIYWDGSQWLCESFGLRVKRNQEGTLQPVEIDPKLIRVKGDPDWLEMGEVQKEEDFWLVSLKIKQGSDIRPPQQYSWNAEGNVKGGQHVTYQLGEETKAQPPRANELLKVQLTVTVQLQSEALLTAATAMAGMIPGGAAAVAAGLGLSKVVTYVVQPPKVAWIASVQEPVRLSGPNRLLEQEEEPESLEDDPQAIWLRSLPLPPGWLEQVTVVAALAQVSRKLQIDLEKIEPLPDVEDELKAYLKVKSNRLVVCPRDDLPSESTFPNAQIELIMITRSLYLGTQVQKGVMVVAEALNVAVYYRNMPIKAHDWQSAQNFFRQDLSKVAVIPKDKLSSPPDLCQLGVRLNFPVKKWPAPAVHWYTEEEFEAIETEAAGEGGGLDDKFQQPVNLETIYQAPSLESWDAAGKPAIRKIVCLVSSGLPGPAEPVPDHQDLYFVAPVETEIDLVQRTRKVRLKIRVGPKDLMADGAINAMDLKDPAGVEQSLIREFFVDLDFM